MRFARETKFLKHIMQTEHCNCVFMLWLFSICLLSSSLVLHWNWHTGVLIRAQCNWGFSTIVSGVGVSDVKFLTDPV